LGDIAPQLFGLGGDRSRRPHGVGAYDANGLLPADSLPLRYEQSERTRARWLMIGTRRDALLLRETDKKTAAVQHGDPLIEFMELTPALCYP